MQQGRSFDLLALPTDILLEIILRLDAKGLIKLSSTCKICERLCKDARVELVWRKDFATRTGIPEQELEHWSDLDTSMMPSYNKDYGFWRNAVAQRVKWESSIHLHATQLDTWFARSMSIFTLNVH